MLEIASQVERLSNEVRQAKLKLEDLRGGTFTVTSIGNVGGLFSTPIINHPELGIVGIGKITKRPIFDEQGQIKAADMLYLSFSFDHRILDGADRHRLRQRRRQASAESCGNAGVASRHSGL